MNEVLLNALIKEFLLTLDDKRRFFSSRTSTDREIARSVLENFIEWSKNLDSTKCFYRIFDKNGCEISADIVDIPNKCLKELFSETE